jgi:hypothetical protein
MPIKISQLPELTVVDSATLFATVDPTTTPGTPVSKKATALNVADFILSGNAASASTLETPRNINGVAFDGSADITITTPIAPATTSIVGGVIVSTGLNVAVDGTLTVNTSTIATKTYVDNTSTDNAISFSVALG